MARQRFMQGAGRIINHSASRKPSLSRLAEKGKIKDTPQDIDKDNENLYRLPRNTA